MIRHIADRRHCLALLTMLLAVPAAAQERALLSIPESIEKTAPPKSLDEPPPAATTALLEPPAAPPSDDAKSVADLSRALKPAQMLGVDIHRPAGKLPRDFAAERLAEHPTPAGQVLVRGWPTLYYNWKAPGSRHYPLYFEEINPERYGYTHSHCLQPVISGAHFFGTIPALPYLMAANCPRECVYTLGHYRPGSCNPWRAHCWPFSPAGAAAEAGVVIGLIALIP